MHLNNLLSWLIVDEYKYVSREVLCVFAWISFGLHHHRLVFFVLFTLSQASAKTLSNLQEAHGFQVWQYDEVRLVFTQIM